MTDTVYNSPVLCFWQRAVGIEKVCECFGTFATEQIRLVVSHWYDFYTHTLVISIISLYYQVISTLSAYQCIENLFRGVELQQWLGLAIMLSDYHCACHSSLWWMKCSSACLDKIALFSLIRLSIYRPHLNLVGQTCLLYTLGI